MKKIFLSAPISGFNMEEEYKKNRNIIIELIKTLRNNYYIYSEVENINNLNNYDEPGKSALKDFARIKESDIFILYHPNKMQTSSLIELGYAIAFEKQIITISKKEFLPYLALGLSSVLPSFHFIKMLSSTTKLIEEIVNCIKLL